MPAFLALSCVAFASPSAQAAVAEADTSEVAAADQIVVSGARQAGEEAQSPKVIAPLLDTPQTVTVISDQTLRKQNLLTLRDALATIPGITFGAGEGGGGYGDSINLRGYSANNDITVDGVRDSAQYSRTDPFYLQQIEIYNGANSVYNGSGSVGGTINLVSKAPQADDLTIVSAAAGTDDYYRATVDTNLRVSEPVAVRLNAMVHRNDVPGRDVERFKRWGVAPAITLGIAGPTSLTLDYFHQRDDNTPIYGVPYFKNEINDGPLSEADDSDYFGIVNLDEQETTVDRLSATLRHEFSGGVSLRNLTRWQRVGQYSVTSAPQGTFCLTGSGRQPITAAPGQTVGAACTASIQNVVNAAGVFRGAANPLTSPNAFGIAVPPGFFQPNGPRGRVRDQVNQLLYNQTDLRIESGAKGGTHNTLVIGGAATVEDYAITTAELIRDAQGRALILPQTPIPNPDTTYTGPINYTVTARSKASTTNLAIYAFDNLEFGPHFELNGGVRYESNRARFRPVPLAFYPAGTAVPTAAELAVQSSRETLFSWRAGAIYKPVGKVSLYAAVANSSTPSSATVRLGCTSGSGATFVNFCNVAPEKARSYEIGAKAEVGKVLLTAAAFRNERTNYRVPSNDPAQPAGLQVLDGRSRVDGIALGASGYVTPRWLVFANYTYLDGRVKQSVSDACLAAPSAACLNSAAIRDPQAGDRLLQTPEHSGSLFTSYRFPFGLEVGYGLTYQGSFALHQRTLLQRRQFKSDDYVTQRLLVSYPVTPRLAAQFNVQNLFDEDYYTSIRNNVNATSGVITGGWATPGDARQATLSLFYSF
ncbi:TonB-dependent receptor [Novosphingobium sp. Gsoil 351]|nr:TonB-dependent receptor [Novosphingobium sp. Gsoil 351]